MITMPSEPTVIFRDTHELSLSCLLKEYSLSDYDLDIISSNYLNYIKFFYGTNMNWCLNKHGLGYASFKYDEHSIEDMLFDMLDISPVNMAEYHLICDVATELKKSVLTFMDITRAYVIERYGTIIRIYDIGPLYEIMYRDLHSYNKEG